MAGGHMMLMGGGGNPVKLTNQSVTDFQSIVLPGTASSSCTYRLLNTGVVEIDRLRGSDSYPVGEWLTGGSPGNYDARFTLLSGTLTGTFGSWLNLATSRSIGNSASRSIAGTTTVTGSATVEIRRTSTGQILGTATITLESIAECEP